MEGDGAGNTNDFHPKTPNNDPITHDPNTGPDDNSGPVLSPTPEQVEDEQTEQEHERKAWQDAHHAATAAGPDDDDDNDDDDDDDDARASPFPDPPPTPPAESWPPGAEPPKSFICPIELAVMRDPVVAADGQSYERRAIERWLVRHHTSPLTGERLASKELRPNFALKSLIGDFRDTARRAHAEAAST